MRRGSIYIALWGLVVTVLAAAALAMPGRPSPDAVDLSFGSGGHVTLQVNPVCANNGEDKCVESAGSYAEGLVLEPGDRIVLGGREHYVDGRRTRPTGALVGLRSNGTLDPVFGTAGITNSYAFEIERLYNAPDGTLLAVGPAESSSMGVERYKADGTPDTAFGINAVRWLKVPVNSSQAFVDSAGRIVVAGGSPNRYVVVERFSKSGLIDTRFGSGGAAALPVLRSSSGELTVATESDGSVIIAGVGRPSRSATTHTFVARLNSNGTLDRRFGSHGVIYVPLTVLTVDQQSPATVIGVAANSDIRLVTADTAGRLVAINYTPSGHLDRRFGMDGIARTSPPQSAWTTVGMVRALTFDAAGDAIVVGEHRMHRVDVPDGTAFIARYTPHGRDCSFGVGGIAIDQALGGASAVAIQASGRIVVAGWSSKAFAAVRYVGGGHPRTCPNEGRGD